MADAVDFIVALACEEEGGKERFLSHTSTMIQWPNAIATAPRTQKYDVYRLYGVSATHHTTHNPPYLAS